MDPKTLLERIKTLTTQLSPTQMVSIGMAFLVVVLLMVGSSYWLTSTDYMLLFADMEPEAANEVVARLKTQKIPYTLDQGGRSIRVPSNRVDELRLEFAGQGLPASGRIGFEIFDRTAFGATEFLEQVNYRRALEGEIGRTISTIAEVSGARVHIAPAKESLFGAEAQPAKASVILKLKNANRPLSAATVHGISSLVAASIEGLRPESVVIVDTYGRPLSRPADGDDGPMDAVQLERQQRVERDLTTKVVNLLDAVVGPERVRVNVSARLNAQTQEETEERWDPNAAVVRSRQTSADGVTPAPGTNGLAGARGNLPGPVPAGATTPATPTPQVVPAAMNAARTAETTNYEISKVTRHTVRPRGEVARLSVAVIVDDEPVVGKDKSGNVTRSTRPRQPAELQKIQGIVAAAVGIDTTRGDVLTVENVAFGVNQVEEPVPPTFFERNRDTLSETGRVLAVILMALLAFLFVVRPLMRRGLASVKVVTPVAMQPLPEQLPKTVEQLQGELEAQLAAAEAKAGEPRKLTVLTKRLSSLVQKQPESAARLVRTWLAEEEGR